MLLVSKKRPGKQIRTLTSKRAQFRCRLFIPMRKSYPVNSNSFQRRCVYFWRGTLTFCSQTNLSIRPNPCGWGGGGGGGIGETGGDESLPKSLILRLLICAFSFLFFFLANLGSSIRMYPYVSRMYSYVTRMYQYVLLFFVCHSNVTRMYSYVLVCYSYVLVCYPYVLVCNRMSLVCHPCGALVTIGSGYYAN